MIGACFQKYYKYRTRSYKKTQNSYVWHHYIKGIARRHRIYSSSTLLQVSQSRSSTGRGLWFYLYQSKFQHHS